MQPALSNKAAALIPQSGGFIYLFQKQIIQKKLQPSPTASKKL